MKKQLIKELDENGKIWYYTVVDGKKVTSFQTDYNFAKVEFDNYNRFTPIKTVIEEADLKEGHEIPLS